MTNKFKSSSIVTIQSNAQFAMEQFKTRDQVKLQNLKLKSTALNKVQILQATMPKIPGGC